MSLLPPLAGGRCPLRPRSGFRPARGAKDKPGTAATRSRAPTEALRRGRARRAWRGIGLVRGEHDGILSCAVLFAHPASCPLAFPLSSDTLTPPLSRSRGTSTWGRDRAEAVLHLRCVLLNGQWKDFEHHVAHRSLSLAAQPVPARTHDAVPRKAA